jgi:hypothetical protein
MKYALVLALAATCTAQSPRQHDIIGEVLDKAAVKQNGPDYAGVVRRDAVTGASDIDRLIAAWLLDSRRGTEALRRLLDGRTGVETGAPAATPGAGSLVMKGAAPLVLSLAIDNGGVLSGHAGPAVTIRSTPRGLAGVFAGVHPAARTPEYLDRFSGSATFGARRVNHSDALAASAAQLVSWSARWQAIDRRKPRGRAFVDDWARLATAGAAYRGAAESIAAGFSRWPELVQWQSALTARIEREVERPRRALLFDAASARTVCTAILAEEFAKLRGLPAPERVERALSHYTRELTAMLEARRSIDGAEGRGTLLAVDFTSLNNPPPGGNSWIATAVLETRPRGGSPDDAIFNLGLDSWNRFQAGLAYEVPRGTTRFTLAARYAAQPGLGRSASAQAALTLAVAPTGLRVPVSVSATHISAVSKTDVSVQIGLHYHADALFLRSWTH